MKCVICNSEIEETEYGWKHGHNAEPVKDGRCCSRCNWELVIPTRIMMEMKYNDNRQTEGRDRT